jgi:putative transposase
VFVYVAFVIDAYAGAIVGWEGSASKQTRFVESALRQAAALRSRQGHPIDGAIHHSDAGSQYTSVRFGETLSLSSLRPSVGSVGDAYDNALAETTIGLFKNECIRADSPFRRGPLRTWPTSNSSPLTTSPGTTSNALCTAWAVFHPPKPKLSTIPNM